MDFLTSLFYYGFMGRQSLDQNIAAEIEEEYQEFLARLDLLKKEQEQLIKKYREKLKQRKLLRSKRSS